MYNGCNSCGTTRSNCCAVNILNQIARLVCGTNGTSGNNGNSCGGCNTCSAYSYSFPVSGRVFVNHSNGSCCGCNNGVNIVLQSRNYNGCGCAWNNTSTSTSGNGYCYGGWGNTASTVTNGNDYYASQYGYSGRGSCGCAFSGLNN